MAIASCSKPSTARSCRVRMTLITAIFSLPLGLAPPTAAQTFQSAAPQAILLDVETGSVLYERAADDLVAPASLAKLMTIELVFHALAEGRLTPDSEVVISENAWRKGGAPSRGSSMYAALNSRVRISDIIPGIVVLSGNDAAIAVAETLAGDETTFARLMTDRAKELGLTKTTYRNATGLPSPDQRTTVREIAALSDHIIRAYPDLYKNFALREFTWNRITQKNRNPLLTMDVGADGLKTGNIDESGFSLAGSAVQNGQRLIVVVSGLKTDKDRSLEARKLLEWGFRAFESRVLFEAGASVAEVKLFGGAQGSVPVTVSRQVRVLAPRGSGDRISGQVVYTGPVSAPVKTGDQLGVLRVMRGSTLALERPIEAKEDVAAGPLVSRALDAFIELAGSIIRRNLHKS